MAEKLYPNTLVSGREDGKLANSDNLYDKVQKMMQEALNIVLAKYFNFATGNANSGSLDGRSLADGSVSIDSLNDDLKAIIEQSAALLQLTTQVNQLRGVVNSLESRILDLETNNTDILETEEDGFFLVDTEDNVGACVTPNFVFGWDGAPSTVTPTYTARHGGTKILVRGADFSEMGLGKLGENAELNYINVDFQPSYKGTEFTLTARPNPTSYEGGYTWRVTLGSDAVRIKSQTGNTATFEILPGANGSTVKVLCMSSQYTTIKTDRTFQVTYGVELESVSIEIVGVEAKDNDQKTPISGKNFQMLAKGIPSTATVKGIYWKLDSGSNAVEIGEENAHDNPATFTIKPEATVPTYAVIHCEMIKEDGNAVLSPPMTVWVKYDSGLQLESIRITGADEKMTTEEKQLALVETPTGADMGEVTWNVSRGPAKVSSKGLLSLAGDAKKGDLIVVEATSSVLADEDGTAVAVIENQCVPRLEKLGIEPGNTIVEGQGIQLTAVPTPYVDDYKHVNWNVVTGSEYASVDSMGYVAFAKKASHSFVVVKATSRIDPTISAMIELEVTYNAARDTRWIEQRASVGGEYIDFFAMSHTSHEVDGSQRIADNDVVWSVVSDEESESVSPRQKISPAKPLETDLSMPAVTPSLLLSSSDGPAFSDADHPYRLVLANREGVQQVTVRCALKEDSSIYRDEIYEFAYQAGKLPLTGLTFDMSEYVAPVGGGYYTKLREHVHPYPDNAVYDPSRVSFTHDNSDYCSLEYDGRVAVKEGVIGAKENWTIGYALEGESKVHPKEDSVKIVQEMTLTRLTQVITATSIRIVAGKQYTGETAGQIIDGGQLGVVDQDGNPVRDQNGNVVRALYSVVEGGQYCSINSLGYDMRIYDTGGEFRSVTVKAVVKDLVAKATFEVKLMPKQE